MDGMSRLICDDNCNEMYELRQVKDLQIRIIMEFIGNGIWDTYKEILKRIYGILSEFLKSFL